jgi:hypothetical protein
VHLAATWLLVLLLSGCAGTAERKFADAEDPEIAAAVDREASPAALAICRGYGCGVSNLVGLSEQETRRLAALFEPVHPSAASERQAVARAVADVETSVGKRLGTSTDKPRTPFSLGDPTQLDCVDESINTSGVLHMLARMGWLQWHVPGEPARRHAFLGFGVHYTAVLIDKESGAAYAVDSWFHANGVPAEVVELNRWREGWAPAGP